MEALLMLKVKTAFRLGRLLVGTFLVVGLAGPAFAGNVYSWVTEDGTYAFTDDSKRIPAKHRSEAKRRPMGKLSRYERFTEVTAEQDKPYAERIRERRDQLREIATAAPQGAIVGGTTSSQGIGYTLPVGGGSRGARSTASVWLPLDSATTAMDRVAADEDGPTVIESKRMRTPGSPSTRHWTFITKGDKVVSVIKGERRDRNLDESVQESSFDYWDPSDR
jgi:hypothetical protein